MKHLKTFENVYRKPFNYLGKEELDKLSMEEVEKHRYDLVDSRSSMGRDPFSEDEELYLKELSTYEFIRTKQSYFDMHSRWATEAEQKIGTETEISSKRLITKIPPDVMFKMRAVSEFKEADERGGFKFIKLDNPYPSGMFENKNKK